MKKCTYQKITQELLNSKISAKYGKAKWIIFCEILLKAGYNLKLYEARKTFSKYIYVSKAGKTYKVRFSNHKPAKWKEFNKDCDFFVGIGNLGVTNTNDALNAVENYFNKRSMLCR